VRLGRTGVEIQCGKKNENCARWRGVLDWGKTTSYHCIYTRRIAIEVDTNTPQVHSDLSRGHPQRISAEQRDDAAGAGEAIRGSAPKSRSWGTREHLQRGRDRGNRASCGPGTAKVRVRECQHPGGAGGHTGGGMGGAQQVESVGAEPGRHRGVTMRGAGGSICSQLPTGINRASLRDADG